MNTPKVGRTRKAKSRRAHRIVIRDAAVQFFYDNAGYSYNPQTETPEQGKLRGAEELAKAERYAADQNWCFCWEWDEAGCSGCDCGNDECPCSAGTDHETLVCLLRDYEGNVLASLGGICGATPNYSRVVEAELALEAMPD